LLTTDRARLGWSEPEMGQVRVKILSDLKVAERLIDESKPQSIHICQGIRGNSSISKVHEILAARRSRQWIIMETVDDNSVFGPFKRWEYARLFHSTENSIEGILAIGHKTTNWIVDRGVPAAKVYPFAYFLPAVSEQETMLEPPPKPFRFIYVGQFIPRKCIGQLIRSLHSLSDCEFHLWVVGAGPREKYLRRMAERNLPNRVTWYGQRPLHEVPRYMKQADCLVLPSRHDGWGAVISESIMVGTPVICSDACGAAGVVKASGAGGVFPAGRADSLQELLKEQLESGPVSLKRRAQLASWGNRLSAKAGAVYLLNILNSATNGNPHPLPPWQTGIDQNN
jgi:glycosyltransferase involved in cell wall biosynthesis